MTIIYGLVSVGKNVLAEYTATSGEFRFFSILICIDNDEKTLFAITKQTGLLRAKQAKRRDSLSLSIVRFASCV